MEDPSTRTWTRLSGAARLVGLLFLLSGVTALYLQHHLAVTEPASFAMGLGMTAIGLGVTFGNSGVRVSRRDHRVSWWFGLFVPMYRVDYALEDFASVRIDRERRHSRNTSYLVYPVRLIGRETLLLDESRDYLAARRIAEESARFLEFDLMDASSGTETLRPADALDEPLRERWLREKESFQMPTPPLVMKSRVQENGGQVRIEIPMGGLRTVASPAVLFWALPLLMVVPAILALVRSVPADASPMFLLPIVPILLPLTICIGMPLLALRGHSVTADSTGLVVDTRTPIWTRQQRIETADLEELHVAEPKGGFLQRPGPQRGNPIVARSDRSELSFGAHLSANECEYLAACIRQAMISG
jgi:hypothetical protein